MPLGWKEFVINRFGSSRDAKFEVSLDDGCDVDLFGMGIRGSGLFPLSAVSTCVHSGSMLSSGMPHGLLPPCPPMLPATLLLPLPERLPQLLPGPELWV